MTENPIYRWLEDSPFGCSQQEKRARLLESLQYLTAHHYEHCHEYRNILDHVFQGERSCKFENIEDAPFIPVSLFKKLSLKSIPDADVFKTLKSSGTTGQELSQVFLDRETAELQSKVLVKLMQQFLGKQRRPMVILDNAGILKDRSSFSARGAGILGMSQFGRQPFYAFNEDMTLNLEGLRNYLERFKNQGIFFFGFTFMVWKHFVLELERQNESLKLSDSILIHSGGWKKLRELAVDSDEFRSRIEKQTGISNVLNFYGMVEQVGSVFFENPLHYLHAPLFSEVLIRDPITLKVVPDGTPGIVQVLSMIPKSYPGHSILTEDLGVIRGENSSALQMKGRYFEILGRVPQAELRGCSDTFALSDTLSGSELR